MESSSLDLFFHISPYIDLLRGQGQAKIIICIILKYLSTQLYIPSLKNIGQLVLENKICKGFCLIWVMPHIDHVTWMAIIFLFSPSLEAFPNNFSVAFE